MTVSDNRVGNSFELNIRKHFLKKLVYTKKESTFSYGDENFKPHAKQSTLQMSVLVSEMNPC